MFGAVNRDYDEDEDVATLEHLLLTAADRLEKAHAAELEKSGV